MPRSIDPLVLSMEQRSELQRCLVALGTPQQVALRCRIILAVAAGKTEMAIAAENGVNRKTVRLWRERFRIAVILPSCGFRPRAYGGLDILELGLPRHTQLVMHLEFQP